MAAESDESYTAEQAALAQRALTDELGQPPTRFAQQQFLGMLGDELVALRQKGAADDQIADLLSANTGTRITPSAIAAAIAEVEEFRQGRGGS